MSGVVKITGVETEQRTKETEEEAGEELVSSVQV